MFCSVANSSHKVKHRYMSALQLLIINFSNVCTNHILLLFTEDIFGLLTIATPIYLATMSDESEDEDCKCI